jgi:hypothetical protein
MSRDILAPCRFCDRPIPWRLHRALDRRVVFGLAEQDGLRRCPAFGPRPVRGAGLCIQVVENLLDDGRVFDAGDDLHRPTTLDAGLDVDVEDTLQALCPRH